MALAGDPIWHVISRSGEMISTNPFTLLTFSTLSITSKQWRWEALWRRVQTFVQNSSLSVRLRDVCDLRGDDRRNYIASLTDTNDNKNNKCKNVFIVHSNREQTALDGYYVQIFLQINYSVKIDSTRHRPR